MSSGGYASTSYVHKGNDEEGECDEDEILANFLESEILSVSNGVTTTTTTLSRAIAVQHEAVVEKDGEDGQLQQQQHLPTEGPACKRKQDDLLESDELKKVTKPEPVVPSLYKRNKVSLPSPPGLPVIVHTNTTSCSSFSSTLFSNIPPEVLHHILKFLSSEDLISCSLVCRFMNHAASDDSLWRRLYCMRWGLSSPAGKLHTCPWKKLYIQRDQEDMIEFIRNTPSEFKEYYIQMQAAKRSQAPLPSQVNDDSIILDKTVADLVSIWKRKRGLTDNIAPGHICSGNTCTYSQIGDVFLCDRTGRVHVCDDACREVVLDPDNGVLVCTISGHCFDRLLSPEEELDAEQHAGTIDEPEPFMGSGRFARAYLLGYNCLDEKELEATLRFC